MGNTDTAPAPDGARLPLILIVDNDGDTRALYGRAFAGTSCDLIDAADGRDALVKALSRVPALVITELHLPMLDGFALCEILRRDAATSHVPIVVVTAETRPEALNRARIAGASVVLVKPAFPLAVVTEAFRLLAATSDVPGNPFRDLGEDEPAARPARPQPLVRSYRRFVTTMPPLTPPILRCPSCDALLVHQLSHVGGVSERHPEQWDSYLCPASCGAFQYRHRSRTLRQGA